MTEADKYLSLDIARLQQYVSFEYLELFELSMSGPSPTHTAYPLPVEVETPFGDGIFYIVSARAAMSIDLNASQSVTVLPKERLLKNWEYNIVAVITRGNNARVLLFFYTRSIPACLPDPLILSQLLGEG